jgi:hypothetical protein
MTQDNPKADIRCVVCNVYCDESGLCDKHKYDEQRGGQTETDHGDAPSGSFKHLKFNGGIGEDWNTYAVGGGQTETDELSVSIQVSLPMDNDGKIVVDKYRLKQFIARYSHHQTIEILEKLANVETHATQDNEFSDGYAAGFKALKDDIEAELARLRSQGA